MSQFEFVSVGVALVYSFTVARLLAALPFALARDRRYWIHLVWFGIIMLALPITWWQIWLFRDVAWNLIRFVWALSIPSLIYLRAGTLVSPSPPSVRSWREHYYQARVPFFTIGLAIAANGFLLPWVMGLVRWFTPSPHHIMPLILTVLYVVGLATHRPAIHAGLGIVNLLALVVALVLGTLFDESAV
jgi:hypothetical protein